MFKNPKARAAFFASQKEPQQEQKTLKIPGLSIEKLPTVDDEFKTKPKQFRMPRLQGMMTPKLPKLPKV